jgi:hypothetical protein
MEFTTKLDQQSRNFAYRYGDAAMGDRPGVVGIQDVYPYSQPQTSSGEAVDH